MVGTRLWAGYEAGQDAGLWAWYGAARWGRMIEAGEV